MGQQASQADCSASARLTVRPPVNSWRASASRWREVGAAEPAWEFHVLDVRR